MTKLPKNSIVEAEWAKLYPWAKYANFCMTGNKHQSFVCTRETGHSGDHVAHLRPDIAVAAWDSEDEKPYNPEYRR
jgi:hypothetical protein